MYGTSRRFSESQGATMTFESAWLSLVEKKPEIVEPKATVTIQSDELKKLLLKFYAKGFDAGLETLSLFDQVFGKHK